MGATQTVLDTYELGGLLHGQNGLSCQADGYRIYSATINLAPGELETHDVYMTPLSATSE